MNLLAVIPARGGSKGIPRKNVRLMHGEPLIHYAIANGLSCPLIQDVAVTSDDEEILWIAQREGAIPLRRSSDLARDAVTLDPVIYDALLQMEARTGKRYDGVITLQWKPSCRGMLTPSSARSTAPTWPGPKMKGATIPSTKNV